MAYNVYVKLKKEKSYNNNEWLSICKCAEVVTMGVSATDAAYMMIDALKLLVKDTEYDMHIELQHMEIGEKLGALYIAVDSENKWEQFCESRKRRKKSKTPSEDQPKNDQN